MIFRRAAAAVLALTLLATPLAPARAWGGGGDPDSKIGVLLMAVCGISARLTPIAPVPWGGIAVVTCAFGLLDAALSPDDPAPAGDGGHH